MSKKEKNIAFFVAFCIEEYKAAKGLTGEEVMELFAKYGVTDYLSKCFEPLHTQGRQRLIAEIDECNDIKAPILQQCAVDAVKKPFGE